MLFQHLGQIQIQLHVKHCSQCNIEIPHHNKTCGDSFCQEAEYHDNQARAKGLRASNLTRKGWIWCAVSNCNTPVKIFSHPLCYGHRHGPRSRPQ